jgi:hypothetical protein
MEPVQTRQFNFVQDDLDFTEANLSAPEIEGDKLIVYASNVGIVENNPANKREVEWSCPQIKITFYGVSLSKRTMQNRDSAEDGTVAFGAERELTDLDRPDQNSNKKEFYLMGTMGQSALGIDVADPWKICCDSAKFEIVAK